MLCCGHFCRSFSSVIAPPHFFSPVSLLLSKIISWPSWHALGPYQPPGMSFMSLRLTISYFSPLVDHVISSSQTNDSLSFTKGFDSRDIHRIHNRAQSIGPVMLLTQGCYGVHNRTTDLFSAIARPRSGIQTRYFSPLSSFHSFTSCCRTVMFNNIDAVLLACSGVVSTTRYGSHVPINAIPYHASLHFLNNNHLVSLPNFYHFRSHKS